MASLFREKSLERISNPDTLDSYISIASPGVWMVLAAIGLLLVAAIVWGIFGTVNVDRDGYLVVDDSSTTLWLSESVAQELTSGSALEAAGKTGLVTSAAGAPVAVSETFAGVDDDTIKLWREGEWVCPLSAAIDLPNGRYQATVTLASYSPLQMIFGGAQTASVGGSAS